MSSKIIEQLREQFISDDSQGNGPSHVSFRKSEQVFDATGTMNVALGDVDSDSDLDAVLANKIEGRI